MTPAYIPQGGRFSARVRPAGQAAAPVATAPAPAPVVAPAPPTLVTSDSFGHVVNQQGIILTDASGKPLQFTRVPPMVNSFRSFLTVVAAIGIPAFIGSYFGARKAAKSSG